MLMYENVGFGGHKLKHGRICVNIRKSFFRVWGFNTDRQLCSTMPLSQSPFSKEQGEKIHTHRDYPGIHEVLCVHNFPLSLSMIFFLGRCPSCWASLPSSYWALDPVPQHQNNQVRMCSTCWWLIFFSYFPAHSGIAIEVFMTHYDFCLFTLFLWWLYCRATCLF